MAHPAQLPAIKIAALVADTIQRRGPTQARTILRQHATTWELIGKRDIAEALRAEILRQTQGKIA